MNNLRTIRRQHHLTMKELGKAVGVSESTISLYETGKHEPDLLTLQRIADYFNVTVDAVLGRDAPPLPPDLDETLINMLISLSPGQIQRVKDFVSGMIANDTG